MESESATPTWEDAEFARMADVSEQQVWRIPQLSGREKVMLALVADVCNQTLGRSFERHVATAFTAGLTLEDIRDVLRSTAFETGYPAAGAAMDRLAAIGGSGTTRVELENPDAQAGPVRTPITPPAEVVAMWHGVDDEFAEFMKLQSGLIGNSSRLSLRERAIAAMTCDVLYQTLRDTFRIHISRALTAGMSIDELRAVLRFSTQFGVTRTWNAFTAFEAHVADLTATDAQA